MLGAQRPLVLIYYELSIAQPRTSWSWVPTLMETLVSGGDRARLTQDLPDQRLLMDRLESLCFL